MKAIWNNKVIAEANDNDLIAIEGNWYFPPGSVGKEYFSTSNHQTHCPWKGDASYYDVVVNNETLSNGAWYYPEPKDGSIPKVGKDFTNYVAFYNDVKVTDE